MAGSQLNLSQIQLNAPFQLTLTAPEIILGSDITIEFGAMLQTISADGCP
jgi:hypothetical protein